MLQHDAVTGSHSRPMQSSYPKNLSKFFYSILSNFTIFCRAFLTVILGTCHSRVAGWTRLYTVICKLDLRVSRQAERCLDCRGVEERPAQQQWKAARQRYEGRGTEGQQMILKVTGGLERAQLAQCSHSSMQTQVQVSSAYVKGSVVIQVCSFSMESRHRRFSGVWGPGLLSWWAPGQWYVYVYVYVYVLCVYTHIHIHI